MGKLIIVVLIGLVMPGKPVLPADVAAIHTFRYSYADLGELSPDARRLLALGASGSYARFGLNDENGGARGLGGWKLACPRFQQYPFESADLLDGVLACGSTAPVLIVAASLAPRPGRPDWNAFVAAVERRLAQDYSCEADLGVRLCKRLPK